MVTTLLIIMKSCIYYTLISSTNVPAVFCNECNKICSFSYKWEHDNVAYWTHNKEKILCPTCAKNFPKIIYRKVFSRKDIPEHRSFYRSNYDDDGIIRYDSQNKKIYKYYFCTKEEEDKEIRNKIVPIIKCKCGNKSCQDNKQI